MSGHDPVKIALIVTTALVYTVLVVFSILAGAGSGVFDNDVGDVSDKYASEITPADGTFIIWGVIFTWQAAWIVYAVSTIFRRVDDTYLYQLPAYPKQLFVLFIANNAVVLGWLFAWDAEETAISFTLLVMALALVLMCLHTSLNSLTCEMKRTLEKCSTAEVWLVRILIQNGLAFYGAWLFGATLLNLGIVLTYPYGDITDTALDSDDSSTVALLIFAFGILMWFGRDVLLECHATRDLVAPYVVNVVLLAGIVENNYDLDDAKRNSELSLVLLIIAAGLLVIKVAYLAVTHKKVVEQNKCQVNPI